METVKLIGLDLAKDIFQLHGVNQYGKPILKKQIKRKDLLLFFVNLPKTTVCMEACGGSNYWARKLRGLGHEVRIISAQFVKPFLKSQKNDANDAEAIVEACSRPSMRFVSLKEVWQQDVQSLHRIRQRLQSVKVSIINQTRSLLMEYGIVIPEGVTFFKKQIPVILEDVNSDLTSDTRAFIFDLYEEYKSVDERKKKYDESLENLAKTHEVCKRLQQIPGVGPLTSTAFVAAVGDPDHFKNGRQVAAWLGLVPKQFSSGGKTKLGRITKRGDSYLRSLLVHGARSVVGTIKLKKIKQNRHNWISEMTEKKGVNVTSVAIANHNVRVMWSMMKNNTNYHLQ